MTALGRDVRLKWVELQHNLEIGVKYAASSLQQDLAVRGPLKSPLGWLNAAAWVHFMNSWHPK
jgi:hypothetical protein